MPELDLITHYYVVYEDNYKPDSKIDKIVTTQTLSTEKNDQLMQTEKDAIEEIVKAEMGQRDSNYSSGFSHTSFISDGIPPASLYGGSCQAA